MNSLLAHFLELLPSEIIRFNVVHSISDVGVIWQDTIIYERENMLTEYTIIQEQYIISDQCKIYNQSIIQDYCIIQD